MDKNQTKKVIKFPTRSHILAKQIMQTLGMRKDIIEQFVTGSVLKTNYFNLYQIFQAELTEKDNKVIEKLKKDGKLVYHILVAQGMDETSLEIEGDYPISTFERIVVKTSYLYVPLDLYKEAILDSDLDEEVDIGELYSSRSFIEEVIDHTMLSVQEGIVCAYTVDEFKQSGKFNNIEVYKVEDNIVWVF
ncbi:hypothetical protein MKY04_18070 [Lysinibacillus telephonicus]|uniref:hypothetical protein n=1 Tax=Lysinibacillus telephonicus TaxID=1714840 RepID=UPI0031FDC465